MLPTCYLLHLYKVVIVLGQIYIALGQIYIALGWLYIGIGWLYDLMSDKYITSLLLIKNAESIPKG